MCCRLINRLPITAISCTALPLLLHSLNVETSSSASLKLSKESLVVHHRLGVLRAAMETYQLQYEGVDWISGAINHVVNLARCGLIFDKESSRDQQNRQTPPYQENPVRMPPLKPGRYLRLAFTLDVAFSKGRLPEDDGFHNRIPEFGRSDMASPNDWSKQRVREQRNVDKNCERMETSEDNTSAETCPPTHRLEEKIPADIFSITLGDDPLDWTDLITTPTTHDAEARSFLDDFRVSEQSNLADYL